MTEIVVLVPGILGSELRLRGKLVWPGEVSELVLEYAKMDELLDPALEATDVIRSFSISSQYQNLIDDLTACGFREAAVPPTLVTFPYDWRRDNLESATKLADRLDEIQKSRETEVEITLIAHSMGGLVSRCYLESGLFAGRSAFASVRRLITLGTPHLGAPKALSLLLGRERALFLSRSQAQRLASDPRFPSSYQLLPPASSPSVVDMDAGAALQPIDIFEPDTASVLSLVPANLDSAQRFRKLLELTRRPPAVRYFFFSGTRQKTQVETRVLRFGSSVRVDSLETKSGGDGTVPTWSSMHPDVQGEMVGGEHGTIYKDDGLRQTLARLLGAPNVLAPLAKDFVQVAVRDRVVGLGANLEVAITFTQEVDEIEGELAIESVDPVSGISTPVGRTFPIIYRGIAVQTLAVALPGPQYAGAYRVVLNDRSEGGVKRVGADELFVQAVPDGQ